MESTEEATPSQEVQVSQNRWAAPVAVDTARMVFATNLDDLLPPLNEIPAEYKDDDHPMVKLFSRWFFSGLPKGTRFVSRPGVDHDTALRQIRTCMSSWNPQHEHKMAGVAYLLALFFESISVPEEPKP